jgi:uncharacterized protein
VNEPLVIVDTGPLVALIRRDDGRHDWAVHEAQVHAGPFITSESVISETVFLLHRAGLSADGLSGLLSRGALVVAFDLQKEWGVVSTLLETYKLMPGKKRMSLADATLVRLAELNDDGSVFTIDSDFRIYRKHRREEISLIIPPDVK